MSTPREGSQGGKRTGRPWNGRRASLGAIVLATLGVSSVAHAEGQASIDSATIELASVEREAPAVEQAVAQARVGEMSVEQRLANGELLYRSKDYDRAATLFSEVIERAPGTPSHADALFLRGETYYEAGELLSARRDFRTLLDHVGERPFQPFAARAVGRLVDIALRLTDASGLDGLFRKLEMVPGAGLDPIVAYARGKAFYIAKDYTGASQAFRAVTSSGNYAHQARYFLGLVSLKLARPNLAAAASAPKGSREAAMAAALKPALEAFRMVTELPPDSPEHQHVIDLAWMAVARINYEAEQFQEATEAYGRVSRDSAEFDTMLYELAWVYVRMGDVERAERALEVLSVANPDSILMADGTLLRADLLLRAGRFDNAVRLYEAVREKFVPLRNKVDTFVSAKTDVALYYDTLTKRDIDVLDQDDKLPPMAVKWAREAEDGQRAFGIIDDVRMSRDLLAKSDSILERLRGLMGAANRVRLFPELLAGEEQAVRLLNRVSRARLELSKGLDASEQAAVTGEISAVRSRRRQLADSMGQLPVTPAEFGARENQGNRRWDLLSQRLTEQNQAIDRLNAEANGLRLWLRDDPKGRDPKVVASFVAEIESCERDLKIYREEAATLRQQIEVGRIQIGFGDARYQDDAVRRAEFRDIFEREVDLASRGAAGSNADSYAKRMGPALAQARALEDRLVTAFAALEERVNAKTLELQTKVEEERKKIASYKEQIEVLDSEGRELVGRIAQRNVDIVAEKFRNIVLRADVGITEEAWETRELAMDRVRTLQTERAREERLLDDEMKEVLDDAGDAAPAEPSPTK